MIEKNILTKLTSDSTSNVSTVAHGVSGAATDGVVPERGTAAELGVRGEDTSVYDVGVGTATGGAVVDVRRRARRRVGDGTKTPS